MSDNKNLVRMTLLILSVSLLIIIIKAAWISDDAAITLRTVLNFTHGFGPNFNIGERVQAYTHPLWFLLLTGASLFFPHIFDATFLVSIVVSFWTVYFLLWKFRRNIHCLLIISVIIALSKSFIDYSTSGLENPLSHLLLVVFVFWAFPSAYLIGSRLKYFYLLSSAVYLNRPDLFILILPSVVYLTYRHKNNRTQLWRSIWIGALPLVLWTGFSLLYYGFPFPNTSYAKLGNGIGFFQQFEQGLRYFFHAIDRDPLTILVMALGAIMGIVKHGRFRSLAWGIIFYNLYILYIGGDFMEGRFYAAPFLIGLIIFAFALKNLRFRDAIVISAIPIIFLGSVTFQANILSGNSYSSQVIPADGIADERAYYFQYSNLVGPKATSRVYSSWELKEPQTIIMCGGLGFAGLIKGPSYHIIDSCGLADAFVSRLKLRTDIPWRIGHFYRNIPEEYENSINANKNLLKNPCERDLYDSIRVITRDPVFSPTRLWEVFKMNWKSLRGSVKC